MRKMVVSAVWFTMLTVGTGVSGASTILVEDNFNSLGSNDLNGSSPSTNATGISNLKWVAKATDLANPSPSPLKGNGAQGLAAFTTTQSAGINLGSSYFTTNPGLYRVSVDITYPSTLGPTPESWVGFGFSQGMSTSANLTATANNGGPWVFYRGVSSLNYRSLANNGGQISGVDLTAGGSYRLAIELDTSLPQWTFNVFVDGEKVGTTYTYGAGLNPENLSYISLSTGVSGSTFTGTVDNFRFELVPEPGSFALSGMAGALLLVRRRR